MQDSHYIIFILSPFQLTNELNNSYFDYSKQVGCVSPNHIPVQHHYYRLVFHNCNVYISQLGTPTCRNWWL